MSLYVTPLSSITVRRMHDKGLHLSHIYLDVGQGKTCQLKILVGRSYYDIFTGRSGFPQKMLFKNKGVLRRLFKKKTRSERIGSKVRSSPYTHVCEYELPPCSFPYSPLYP